MFSLRASAARFQDDLFYSWNSGTELFDTSSSGRFTGRLFRIDRFTTIYHRPTRRRQLTIPPDVVLPASKVVKHAATGEIFILSETMRNDAVNNRVYDRVLAVHLAMAPSGGLGSLRRHEIEGTGDDPGPAALTEVAKIYFDAELRTAQREQGGDELDIGQYFLTFPHAVPVRDEDWVVFGSTYYKIVEPYIDGGFSMARAVKHTYDLVTVTYYRSTGAGGGYDPTTGILTPSVTEERLISATVVSREDVADTADSGELEKLRLYVDVEHITWDPSVGDLIKVGDWTYRVARVSMSRSQLQWELSLMQWAVSL